MVERSASVAERARWEELRARLRVSDAESAVAVAVAEERLASGNKGNARNARSVFACADALHAMAVTANAKAYRSLESTGFALPALLHTLHAHPARPAGTCMHGARAANGSAMGLDPSRRTERRFLLLAGPVLAGEPQCRGFHSSFVFRSQRVPFLH